ncbi:MTSS-1 protein [Aphelenchoides avenae]|nr:MTSS-1 protein [Aphelenchus avenae]
MLRSCSSLLATASRLAGSRTIASSASRLQEDRFELFNKGGNEDPDAAPRRRRAPSINRVELLGGVADTPALRVAKDGNEFLTFNMYTNVYYKKANGELVEQREMHTVTGFGPIVKRVQKNVHRGTRVFVQGRLHYFGGGLRDDGTRGQRTASITAEVIEPIAKPERTEQDPRFGGGDED